MPRNDDLFMTKHLARNVPLDFNACVERERLAVVGDLDRRRHKHQQFSKMIDCLSDEDLAESVRDRVHKEIVEIQIRYLVLSKTLDQSIPPTPIMKALKSLQTKTALTAQTLADPVRDEIVRGMTGKEPDQPLSASREAFEAAGSLAERAAIAHGFISSVSKDLEVMAGFFDYKAGLTPRGNKTQFAMIYVINALADLFERTNTWQRKAAVNLGIDIKSDANTGEYYRYTGKFLPFTREFFYRVDDAQMSHLEGNSYAERLRQLVAGRKNDKDLFRLLHRDVSVETMLDFMRRAEACR